MRGKSTWAKETGGSYRVSISRRQLLYRSQETLLKVGNLPFLLTHHWGFLKYYFWLKLLYYIYFSSSVSVCLSISLLTFLSVGQRLEDNLQSLELFLYYMGPCSWSTRWSGLVANTLPIELHHQPFFLREGFSVSFRLAWNLPQLSQVWTTIPDFIEAFLRRIRKGLEIDPVVIWWRERPTA